MKRIKSSKSIVIARTRTVPGPWLWAVLFAGLLSVSALAKSLVDSKHNLSATGHGINAAEETHICIFCHTPHVANPAAPHWNRPSHGAIYKPYNSSTAKATFGQPTGSSKLCLSCHDGTVALGMVISQAPIQFAGGLKKMPRGRSNLETDLSNDHPISFVYDSGLAALNGELNDPGALDRAVRLDSGGMMQCVTCHDPHDDLFGQFLVKNNTGSALCLECHNKDYWNGSEHQASAASWNGIGPNPWPNSTETTVDANACGSCHTPHDAGSDERLLRFAEEEENCYTCHNGNVAATNIEAEFKKISIHPVAATTGIHDPTEDLVNAPRHVECSDCHNPHASRSGEASAPAASGALDDVKGIGSSGSVVDPLINEYELCYRCHADSIDRGAAYINRQFLQTNTRFEFSSSSASYHPVETIGKNPEVPSLISPYTESSTIYCTDCHNSDRGPNAGGAGANGPHGSVYAPLLERRLRLTDEGNESPANYALCYKCHDRSSILSDEGFAYHKLHIVDAKTACTTCHDPHGVQSATHLINFNLDYVAPYDGTIQFEDSGSFAGNCTLTCHGVEHNRETYPEPLE
jgi:predicted CXXCH cytochrome family protein